MQPRHLGLILSVWVACMAAVSKPVLAQGEAGTTETETTMPDFQPGAPMKSVPVHHLVRRSDVGRQRTLKKFQPMNSIQLRFVEAEKYEYYEPCHHVDMEVELKTDDGKKTIESLNPFAFQHAVKSFKCTKQKGTTKTLLHLELDPEYAKQVRRWKLSARNVFGLVVPHDFVDLKKNKECFSDLDPEARKWVQKHPMETVVKLVKHAQFLDTKNKPNTVSFTIVKSDIWSRMNRAQSVKINHRPMDEMLTMGGPLEGMFHMAKQNKRRKRSIAEEKGPMWDFEQGLTSATKGLAGEVKADNVDANLDQSSVKGYAQADMAWRQTCIKGPFSGKVRCAKWGIDNSKISGVTEINHKTQVTVKSKNQGAEAAANPLAEPLIPLTDIDVTTPSFELMAPIPLLGFSVPGVFDMGANVALTGSVHLAVLVKATKDLLVNTGSTASCPWIIEWSGSLTSLPVVQFGTCTKPSTPQSLSNSQSNTMAMESTMSFGAELEVLNTKTNNKRAVSEGEGEGSSTGSRQTAAVKLGMTVQPGLSFGLKVFGVNTLSAGVNAPIKLGINSNWDTDKTDKCEANHVALSTEASASLNVSGGFFGFSKSIPAVQSPILETPAICIPHH